MAFSGGMRFCVEADFSKLQMAVEKETKSHQNLEPSFRWEPVKGGNILRTPGLQFPDGFHIRLMEIN
ncbi:hypothetical protein Goshw_007086 [Gossypium schwendimanii]|uniref:Cytochrome P450 n=1 Tax=Gossypium schwendimanii TaxID=34291 RepID=A0A7J9KWK1_GOSSC|nr:hypothetical protein [Gossypium schwendimanii]